MSWAEECRTTYRRVWMGGNLRLNAVETLKLSGLTGVQI